MSTAIEELKDLRVVLTHIYDSINKRKLDHINLTLFKKISKLKSDAKSILDELDPCENKIVENIEKRNKFVSDNLAFYDTYHNLSVRAGTHGLTSTLSDEEQKKANDELEKFETEHANLIDRFRDISIDAGHPDNDYFIW